MERGVLVGGMRLNYKRLGLLAGKAARECARMIGLTSARLDLMVLVWRFDRTQVELATILCVSPSVISRMVDALEELGLVVRTVPLDRRKRVIRPTAQGLMKLRALDVPGIDEGGLKGAQCVGERVWTRYWRPHLSLHRFGSTFRLPPPPFEALRLHNLLNPFRGMFALRTCAEPAVPVEVDPELWALVVADPLQNASSSPSGSSRSIHSSRAIATSRS